MDFALEAKKIHEEIITWQRELHKIPEIGFDLFETTSYIKEQLTMMNVQYKVCSKTGGIIVLINGDVDGKTIAFRADMDVLPIVEKTNLKHASTNGNMHACGHDAHAAMLLGSTKIINTNKEKFKGKVKLIFQPAEETSGGAKPMIENGCLKNPNVDAIVGLHIGPSYRELKDGQIGISYGSIMASVDSFKLKVIGNGGHGAKPHLCTDPIVTASEIILSLQKIISREINPSHGVVITVGKIAGGTVQNVIPDYVEFWATVRTLDNEDRNFVEKRIKEIATGIAKANRNRVEIDYKRYFPPTINDREFTKFFCKSAIKIIGSEDIVELTDKNMGSEDMSYYLQEVPGTFFYLGSFPTKHPAHNSKFEINDEVLWEGPAIFSQVAYDFLQ